MPNRVPKTYDEITRSTVIEPDSSWRPSDQQEHAAYEGFRALDQYEQALFDRIDHALERCGHDTSRVRVEVARDRVTLRGEVRNSEALRDIVSVVGRVHGVADVDDRLVIS